MIKTILIFAMFIPFYAFSQEVTVKCLDLSDQDAKIFYKGIDNHIAVSVKGIDQKNINLVVKGGVLKKDNQQYTVNTKDTNTVDLIVMQNKPNAKVIQTIKFEVRRQQDVVPEINGLCGGIVSVEDIQTFKKVDLRYKDKLLIKQEFKIVSFTLTVAEGYLKEYNSNSDSLTNEQMEVIKKRKSGQKFFIENVIVEDSNGKKRNAGSLAFKIK